MSLPEGIIAGATGHVGHHNSLHELFNDGIDNTHVAAAAAIDGSKLDFDITDANDIDFASIAEGDALRWDASASKVKRRARDVVYVRDYGTNGAALDAAAVDAASAGAALYFHPGTDYTYDGSGLFVTGTNKIHVIGAGRGIVTITLDAGVYLLAPSGSLVQTLVRDLTIVGGAGAFHHTSTSNNVQKHHTFERCNFVDYTAAAISNKSSDMPYFRVKDCQFDGFDADSTIGVALSGNVDNALIEGNSFINNRIDLKLHNAGVTSHITGNDFIHFDNSPADTRARIWLVPKASASNAGLGLTIKDNKFGGENLVSTDYDILFADEDTGVGSDNGTRHAPKFSADSTGYVIGVVVADNKFSGTSGAGSRPVIYSTTPNVRALAVHHNILDGTSPSYLVQFRTAPTNDRTTHTSTFGPNLSENAGVEVGGVPITNAAWLGAVDDPLGQFDGAAGKGFTALPGGQNPAGYASLLATGIRSFTNPFTLTRSNVTDALGGADATEITYTSATYVYASVTAPTVGSPCYLEFDLKPGSTSPMGSLIVKVLYSGPGAIHAKRFVLPPAVGWRPYRIPLIVTTATGGVIVQFESASGASGNIQIGRVRLYHAAEPLNVDGVLVGPLTHQGTLAGFYNTAPVAKPTVTGTRRGNAALADLLTDLATVGLVTDSTTAGDAPAPDTVAQQMGNVGYRESFVRYLGGANITALSTGALFAQSIPLFAGDTVTSLSFLSGTTSMILGSNVDGHLWFALYDPATNLLSQSADQGGSATWAADTVKTLALGTPQPITTTGLYYAAVMVAIGTGGTPRVPSHRGISTSSTALIASTGWPTGVKTLGGSAGSGLTTTAPAGPLTLGATGLGVYCVAS